MTNREVIEYLDIMRKEVPCLPPNDVMALDMAISALEKQVGEKPQITPFEDKGYDYSCPKCGRPFISKINGKWCWGYRLDFCDKCGQRIDWSDEHGTD